MLSWFKFSLFRVQLSKCPSKFTIFFIFISLAFAFVNSLDVPESRKFSTLQGSQTILSGNSTILSENKTFELGFFSNKDQSKWYLGIWYTSIPTPTYVWVANRENPIKNLSMVSLEITEKDGKLALVEEKDSSRTLIWETGNVKKGSEVKLLEQGNLVLYSKEEGEEIVWQGFDSPTDTWLPGMNLTAQQKLISWKSSDDPAPGRYSLRLRPPDYGEIALFYDNLLYWSTGNWTGNAFLGVPEMTIPYIYRFHFFKPFTPMASFGYNEISLDSGLNPPLTRFQMDHMGQMKQYTWSPQTEYWNMFWSQPDNLCRAYDLCGNFGFCNSKLLSPCKCLKRFSPVDIVSWNTGDFSGGCFRENGAVCGKKDGFEEAGLVSYEGATTKSFSGTSRSMCERTCLSNCSCIGLYHNEETKLCKNLYGEMMNIKNDTSDSLVGEKLYLRVSRSRGWDKKKIKLALIKAICGFIVILVIGLVVLFVLRRRVRKRKKEEESVFPVTNLKVFSYKELHVATKGFSEKLGHGGFGAVFLGELSDSTLVAVKRLEKPGSGEKEFRAEVCTIGNIQHVNLVRLRGFCSENSHRLLVYDYMPNGPLSSYLRRKDGKNLSWDVRFRVLIGTARGISYLHEECRNCIIHCDIKPENILLDEDFSAKVSDFGLAKLIGRDFSGVLATMRGTWGYVAPEWISGVAITTKADVYSYGMTLLELLGGRRNVEGPPSAGGGVGGGEMEGKWFFPPWAAKEIIEGNITAVVDERLGSLYNVAEAERAGLVAIWCIQDDESMRPTMGMVVKMLEGVVEVTTPPPPKLLQALVSGESFHGVGANSGSRISHGDGGSSNDDNVQISMNFKGSLSSI